MEALKMESKVDNWNDDRLDELSRRTDEGFTKVDQRFARVEGEMKEGFAKAATKSELGEVRSELKGEIRHLADKVDRLQLVLIGGFFSLVATLIAGFITT